MNQMDTAKTSSSKLWVAIVVIIIVAIAAWFLLGKKSETGTPSPISQIPAENSAALALGTGTWAETQAINVGSINPAWTSLNDGRVLVVGGRGLSSDIKDARVYNPSTSTWASVAPLNYGGVELVQATTLSDGTVLVTGGQKVGSNVQTFKNASIYNPSTNKWTKVGNMTKDRYDHKAVRLSNGKVLVVGGFPCEPSVATTSCRTAELYNPATKTFTATPNMTYIRNGFSMVYNPSSNKVYTIGGGNVASTSAVEVYDVATNTWSTAAPLNSGRNHPQTYLLNEGKILVAGGTTPNNGAQLSTAEIYDPATNTWTVSNMPGTLPNSATYAGDGGNYPSTGNLGAMLSNGKVLLMGTTVGYLYDSVTNTWTTGPSPMNSTLRPLVVQAIPGGKVLWVGAMSDTSYKTEVYTE